MKAIMVMFDSLNRNMLSPYGCQWTHTPNFQRLARHTVQFDNCYVGSMPCMPARRELHTGRYNFLHRSWGPLEPFDDSMPELLKESGIYTHLATDHYHYFEDGGATYHTRYSSWEGFRGQEGDGWKALVGFDEIPPHRNICGNPKDRWVEQDFINRTFMQQESQQPQSKTFEAGLSFLQNNHQKDNWFLQIETFDPHEPFFAQQHYKDLYPHDYRGPLLDWPDYRPVDPQQDTPESIQHLRMEYAALLSMCDASLGKVLDMMDEHNLWEDTLLIVNTDHGYLLSEHGLWAKCHCPFYNEVANTPLFIWDPRLKKQNRRVQSLAQTIDLPATLLDFFGVPLPPDMQGQPLAPVMQNDTPVRQGGLFGIHGGQVNCTDGQYVYMRKPVESNQPLFQYTLMPTRHGGRRAFMDHEELLTMQLHPSFPFTKNLPVLKTHAKPKNNQHQYATALYDLQADPGQNTPLENPMVEARMKKLMACLMQQNHAPQEQFVRLGLVEEIENR